MINHPNHLAQRCTSLSGQQGKISKVLLCFRIRYGMLQLFRRKRNTTEIAPHLIMQIPGNPPFQFFDSLLAHPLLEHHTASQTCKRNNNRPHPGALFDVLPCGLGQFQIPFHHRQAPIQRPALGQPLDPFTLRQNPALPAETINQTRQLIQIFLGNPLRNDLAVNRHGSVIAAHRNLPQPKNRHPLVFTEPFQRNVNVLCGGPSPNNRKQIAAKALSFKLPCCLKIWVTRYLHRDLLRETKRWNLHAIGCRSWPKINTPDY